MTNRRRMKEQAGLGQAIDARLRQDDRELEEQQTLGAGGSAPLASGGSPAGGGGVTADPALPESFVTGLAGGSGNPPQDGELTITGSGSATVTQDSMAGEIDVHSPDYTAGDGLDLASDEFAVDSTVLRTSGNQSIAGLKTFATLPQSTGTPTDDEDLTTKDYVDERTKIVHRQVFPAAGSRDSVSGNNEINLPWAVSAFPSGASIPAINVVCQSDISFTATPIATLDSNHVELSWNSQQISGNIVEGAQFAICAPIYKVGSVANISALVSVNDPDRFSSVYLSINDDSGSIEPSSPTNMLSTFSPDSWIRIRKDNISIQSLSNVLSIAVTINGTSDSMDVGNTVIRVRELFIEQLE